MREVERPRLIEVMLLGSGISRLNQSGSGSREIAFYTKLQRYFDLCVFGYSRPSNALPELPLTLGWNKWVRSVLDPFLQHKALGKVALVRTKQLWGCWSGFIFAKLTRSPLIIRCGYIWSRSVESQREWTGRIPFKWAVRLTERLMIALADGYIFTTEEVREHYSSAIGSKPRAVIPNGFDINIFVPRSRDEGCHTSEFDYVYVGRLIASKGIDRLCKSLLPEQKLLVIGNGVLSKHVENCKNITMVDGVDNHDLPAYLHQARCFVSLSLTEGNPKTHFEAILCGLYPVLSDLPVHRAIIDELGYGTILHSGQKLPRVCDLNSEYPKLEPFRSKYDMNRIVKLERDFSMQFVYAKACRQKKQGMV